MRNDKMNNTLGLKLILFLKLWVIFPPVFYSC